MAGTASADTIGGGGGGDGGVRDQAQEKAQEVREQAGEQARRAAGEARGRLRDQVDQRSTQAGEQVGRHASDMRDVAQSLREQGKDQPARIAEQVADRVDRAGSWMRDSDGDTILSDVEDFARGNPWAVAAGGLALGFLASRALKASSSRRYEQRSTVGQLPRSTRVRPVEAPDSYSTPAIDVPVTGDAAPTTPVAPATTAGERFTPGPGGER